MGDRPPNGGNSERARSEVRGWPEDAARLAGKPPTPPPPHPRSPLPEESLLLGPEQRGPLV